MQKDSSFNEKPRPRNLEPLNSNRMWKYIYFIYLYNYISISILYIIYNKLSEVITTSDNLFARRPEQDSVFELCSVACFNRISKRRVSLTEPLVTKYF